MQALGENMQDRRSVPSIASTFHLLQPFPFHVLKPLKKLLSFHPSTASPSRSFLRLHVSRLPQLLPCSHVNLFSTRASCQGLMPPPKKLRCTPPPAREAILALVIAATTKSAPVPAPTLAATAVAGAHLRFRPFTRPHSPPAAPRRPHSRDNAPPNRTPPAPFANHNTAGAPHRGGRRSELLRLNAGIFKRPREATCGSQRQARAYTDRGLFDSGRWRGGGGKWGRGVVGSRWWGRGDGGGSGVGIDEWERCVSVG